MPATPSRSSPTSPSAPGSSSRAARPTCAWTRATSCAASRTRPSPQIIAFQRYAVDANQLEQRADQTSCLRPRQRYTTELLQPRPERPHLQGESRQLRRRVARALRQPPLCLRLRARRAGLHGPGPDHAHEPHAGGRSAAFGVAVARPHPRHHLRQRGGVRPAAAPLLYAVPAATAAAGRDCDPMAHLPAAAARGSRARSRGCSEADRHGRLQPRGRRRRAAGARSRDEELAAHAGPAHAAPLRCQALPAVDPGRFRGLRGADLHDRHDRAAAPVAPRQRPVRAARCCGWRLLRLPAFTEILLAFAVLVGSIGALLSLNRKSELIVMRAGGMSVWQFLRPGLMVALVLGVFAVTALQSARRRRPLGGRAAGGGGLRQGGEPAGHAPGEGSWLRQDGADGQSVMNAQRHRRSGPVAGRRDRLSIRRPGTVRRAHRCRQGHASPMAYWELHKARRLPPWSRARGLRHLHGQHLPDARAGRRGPRVGDRGLRLAAARP